MISTFDGLASREAAIACSRGREPMVPRKSHTTAAKRRQRPSSAMMLILEKVSAFKPDIVSIKKANVFLLESCRFVMLALILDVITHTIDL